jgi:hypothetical protein
MILLVWNPASSGMESSLLIVPPGHNRSLSGETIFTGRGYDVGEEEKSMPGEKEAGNVNSSNAMHRFNLEKSGALLRCYILFYIESIMAFRVALGRIAWVTLALSGI